MILSLLLALVAPSAPQQTVPTSSIRREDCPGSPAHVWCGTLKVPENHSQPSGRQIDMWLAVRPSTVAKGSRRVDPVLVILGGPGDAASGALVNAITGHASADGTRDVIMYDARGAGRSGPLSCPYGRDDHPQSYMNSFLPVAEMRDCMRQLAATRDLSRYGADDVVDDLERLRRVLRVDQFNLHATSYGTRVALRYMAKYPNRIRSAVLVAVVPPTLTVPVSFGEDADRSMDHMLADCASDAACYTAFPRLRDELWSVLERLDRASVTAHVPSPSGSGTVEVQLSRAIFGEAVRAVMYSPDQTASLPVMLHEAHGGDFSAIAAIAFARQRGFARGGGLGLYAAVTCLEDISRLDSSRAIADNRGTLVGPHRLQQLLAICPPNQERRSPIEPMSEVHTPVLMLVGTRDPVTPPRWARQLIPVLPNALIVEVEPGRHSFNGLENRRCLRTMSAAFINDPSGAKVDTACLASIRAPAFVTTR